MSDPPRFRLRDLVVVFVLLLIIAAIAVPALLRSRIAANETSAVAALKQLVSSEVTSDRGGQGGGIQDYWVLDVAGLYGMQDSSGAILKFIDINFARADASRRVSYPGKPSPNSSPCRPTPKSGYVFRSMIADDGAGKPTPYAVNYVPTQKDITVLRNSKGVCGYATACNSYLFAFEAIPAEYRATGIRVFIVCEEGVIYGVDRGSNAFVATWPGTDPTAKTRGGRFWSVVQ